MQNTAPGKGMLKVVGILGLVFGGINSFMTLFGVMVADYLDMVMPLDMSWQVYYLLTFAVIVYGIFASIMTVIYCGTLEKAYLLRTLGAISIFTTVGFTIIEISAVGVFSRHAFANKSGIAYSSYRRCFKEHKSV